MLAALHAAMLLAAIPSVLSARSAPPELSGRITSTAGQPIAGAEVVVLELGRRSTTTADGRYRLTELPTGSYDVAFHAIGFAPQVRRVRVAARDIVLDVSLAATAVELAPIQVTATPGATTSLSSPQPVSVLGGERLAGQQSASVGETIRTLPGLNSLSTGTGVGKPVIRGLTSNRVLVLADGQRTESQSWGDEHSPNVETATADRIEVIKGPASVLYGSDALGGVVNIVPRDLPDAVGRNAFMGGRLRTLYGTNNRAPEGTLVLEGAAGSLGLRTSFTGRTASSYRTPTGVLPNTGNDALAGSLAVGSKGAWGSATLFYDQRNERLQVADPDPTNTGFQRITDQRVRLALTFPLGGDWRAEANAGLQRNNRREFESAGATEADVASGLRSTTATTDLHLHHPNLGPISGLIGTQLVFNDFGRFGTEQLIPNSKSVNVGLFAFEQATFGRWTLSAGVRGEFRSLDVEAGSVGDAAYAADPRTSIGAQTRTYTALAANVGVLYRLSEPLALVFNAGRGFRAPSTFELFVFGVHPGTQQFEIGNPGLRNETSLNTDLALRVQTSTVNAEIGGFVNRFDSFIYAQPLATVEPVSGLRQYQISQGDALFMGFEASLDWHPTTWVELRASSDFTHAENRSLDQPLPYIPPLRALYSVTFHLGAERAPRRSWIRLGGESDARQVRNAPNEFDPTGQLAAGPPAGYTLVNAGIGTSFPTGRGAVTVEATVNNLLDTSYIRYLNRWRDFATEMGRNVLIRVGTTF